MVHKIEVGGKEYEYKRPVRALERKVQALTVQLSAKLAEPDSDEVFEGQKKVWREIATLVFVNPDEDVLDYGNITDGESADICNGFFVAARKTNEKPPVG